jgi:hypothetical protein
MNSSRRFRYQPAIRSRLYMGGYPSYAYGEDPGVLDEIYQSPDLLHEGLLSFDYPLHHATDEEWEQFLGKLVHNVSRTASRAILKTAEGAVKGVGKGFNTLTKFVPAPILTAGLSFTPVGMAIRAGLGAASAIADGRNAFQGALRSVVDTPGARFLVDTAAATARGENVLKAIKAAGGAGINDLKESVRFAAMVAPFVPGLGTGVAAALGAANALASGEPITAALIAAAKNAIPGGAIAQAGFETAINIAKGKSLQDAALEGLRSRLPGGPAAQAAFDAGLALAKGQNIQSAVIAAGGRLLPKSPYTADALSFARKVANGENVQRAALSGLGNVVMKRVEQQIGPIVNRSIDKTISRPLAASRNVGRFAARYPVSRTASFMQARI